jgi:hypothetical protein
MSDNDRIERIEADIAELYRRTNHSVTFEAETKITLDYIKSGLDEVKGELKKLLDQPGKRWDGLVNSGIAAVIAAIIAGIVSYLPAHIK